MENSLQITKKGGNELRYKAWKGEICKKKKY